MSKSKKLILNTLALILGNVLFWLCNHYPKHILEVSFTQSIVSTAINFIYYVLFNFFLIIVFSKNKAPFAKNLFDKNESVVKRFELIKLCALMLVQLAVDGIVWLIGKTAGDWNYIVLDIVMVLHWLLIYMIVADKSIVFGKHRRRTLVGIVIVAVLLGLSVVIDNKWIADTTVFFSKYEAESPALLSIQSNLRFTWEVKALVLDTLIGLILLWVHSYAIKDEEPEKDSDILRDRQVASFTIQIFLLFVITGLLMSFKTAIWPNETLVRPFPLALHNEKESWGTLDFSIEHTEYGVVRFNGEDSGNVCYATYSYCVTINQAERVLMTTAMEFPYDYYIRDGEVVKSYNRERLNIEGQEAYLYFNQIIGFYDNGIPCAVKLNELNTFEKNDSVTAVCEQLLLDGNIFAFEYVCDYLLANDREFIQPFIERYAGGNFTDIEKEWMEKNFYKSEYVVDIAKAFS